MAEIEETLETVSLEIFLIIAMESPIQVVLNTERNFIVDYITKNIQREDLNSGLVLSGLLLHFWAILLF